MNKELILVAGATGYIGGRLIPILIDKGYRIRCLARDPSRLQGRWSNVEIIAGDVLKPETLPPAFKDVTIAYYLVHSLSAGEKKFEEQDIIAARYFSNAASSARIKRIIYLGGLGAEEDTLSPHLRSRQNTGRILREGDVPVTEFRAGVIIGSGSLSFELIRYLTERLPVMICPRWVSTRIQPIGVTDVLRYLSACIEIPESTGTIIEIGGTDVMTYADMMLKYAKVRGLKRLLLHVPLLTPRLSSYWVGLVTPIPNSIARLLIEGLKNEVICRSTKAHELFLFTPMGFEEAVKLALERFQSGQVETVWHSSTWAFPQSSSISEQLTNKEGLIIERHQIKTTVSASSIFKVIKSLGGANGWLYAQWLWRIRGMLDRLSGGIGFRRGRRSPAELRTGDPVDFWRVEAYEDDKLLRLYAEMKLPGKAWLEFQIHQESPKNNKLTQTAYFEPHGLAGQLYWASLYPFHRIIFRGLIQSIISKAEQSDSIK